MAISKKQILRIFSKTKDPLSPQEILDQIKKEHKYGAKARAELLRILGQLEQEGITRKTRGGRWRRVSEKELIPARVLSRSRGFAFARTLPPHEPVDVFIPGRDMADLLPGDVIGIKLRQSARGPEGEPLRLIEKGPAAATGRLVEEAGRMLFVPDTSSGIRYHLPLTGAKDPGLREGEKVRAALIFRGADDLRASVQRVFGDASSARVCTDAILDAKGIPVAFTPAALLEAKKIAENFPDPEAARERLDLRDTLVMTIDGADAKDLDDAISLRRLSGGYELGVHIADVSHYVRPGSPLDLDAFERGTSVYFADRVVPMLPPELSNGVCSLGPGEEKLAFSCAVHFDEEGRMRGYRFRKSVIKSSVRGVYSEVNALLAGDASDEIRQKYEPVAGMLGDLHDLYRKLRARTECRGALELESSEPYFVMDDAGRVVDIQRRAEGDAERMIESFMISANVAAAEWARKSEAPFVYRVHETPAPDRMAALRETAALLGLPTAGIHEEARAADLNRLIQAAGLTPYGRVISELTLRSMSKARYATEPIGHYGLALADYCHFTSPIRRYPDLMVHRVLAGLCKGKGPERLRSRFGETTAQAAVQASFAEVRAMEAERACEDCYKAEYMAARIGESFDGVITSVAPHGIYVELPNTVEGLVRFDSLPSYYRYDGQMFLFDTRSGGKIGVGDAMRVTVTRADVSAGQIDFAFTTPI